MGVKTTITTTPPTASRIQSAGLKSGFNIAGLTTQLAEAVSATPSFSCGKSYKLFPKFH